MGKIPGLVLMAVLAVPVVSRAAIGYDKLEPQGLHTAGHDRGHRARIYDKVYRVIDTAAVRS